MKHCHTQRQGLPTRYPEGPPGHVTAVGPSEAKGLRGEAGPTMRGEDARRAVSLRCGAQRGRREKGRPRQSWAPQNISGNPSIYLFFSCGPRSISGLAVPGLQLQHRAKELLRSLGQEADLRVRMEAVEMRRLWGQLGIDVLKSQGQAHLKTNETCLPSPT